MEPMQRYIKRQQAHGPNGAVAVMDTTALAREYSDPAVIGGRAIKCAEMRSVARAIKEEIRERLCKIDRFPASNDPDDLLDWLSLLSHPLVRALDISPAKSQEAYGSAAKDKIQMANRCLQDLVYEVIESRECRSVEEEATEGSYDGDSSSGGVADMMLDIVAETAQGGDVGLGLASPLEADKEARKRRAKDELARYQDHQLTLRKRIAAASGSLCSAVKNGSVPLGLVRDLQALEAAERRWEEEKRSLTSKVVETMRSHFKPGAFLQQVESDCPHVVAVARGLLAHGTSNARPEPESVLAREGCYRSAKLPYNSRVSPLHLWSRHGWEAGQARKARGFTRQREGRGANEAVAN